MSVNSTSALEPEMNHKIRLYYMERMQMVCTYFNFIPQSAKIQNKIIKTEIMMYHPYANLTS